MGKDKAQGNNVEVAEAADGAANPVLKGKVQAKLSQDFYLDAFGVEQKGFALAENVKVFHKRGQSLAVIVVDDNGKAHRLTLSHEAIVVGLRPTIGALLRKHKDTIPLATKEKAAGSKTDKAAVEEFEVEV